MDDPLPVFVDWLGLQPDTVVHPIVRCVSKRSRDDYTPQIREVKLTTHSSHGRWAERGAALTAWRGVRHLTVDTSSTGFRMRTQTDPEYNPWSHWSTDEREDLHEVVERLAGGWTAAASVGRVAPFGHAITYLTLRSDRVEPAFSALSRVVREHFPALEVLDIDFGLHTPDASALMLRFVGDVARDCHRLHTWFTKHSESARLPLVGIVAAVAQARRVQGLFWEDMTLTDLLNEYAFPAELPFQVLGAELAADPFRHLKMLRVRALVSAPAWVGLRRCDALTSLDIIGFVPSGDFDAARPDLPHLPNLATLSLSVLGPRGYVQAAAALGAMTPLPALTTFCVDVCGDGHGTLDEAHDVVNGLDQCAPALERIRLTVGMGGLSDDNPGDIGLVARAFVPLASKLWCLVVRPASKALRILSQRFRHLEDLTLILDDADFRQEADRDAFVAVVAANPRLRRLHVAFVGATLLLEALQARGPGAPPLALYIGHDDDDEDIDVRADLQLHIANGVPELQGVHMP
jgi:hypothetical protein